MYKIFMEVYRPETGSYEKFDVYRTPHRKKVQKILKWFESAFSKFVKADETGEGSLISSWGEVETATPKEKIKK